MSDPDRPSSMSGNSLRESHSLRRRLCGRSCWACSALVSADPPAADRPPLSAAQRCATDALTLVFGLIEFEDVICAARTCKAWLAAAAKEKPRGLTFECRRDERLADFCGSYSPLKRHVSRVDCKHGPLLDLAQLVQLRQLPELTALEVGLNAAELIWLVQMPKDSEGAGGLAALQAAFPPKLQELTLWSSETHSTAVCQLLLLDAMPAMKGLQKLELVLPPDVEPAQTAALSLEPLLQLPRLTHLTWFSGGLTIPQLRVIKQIATLQFFDPGLGHWSPAQLSAFCRPPHRLQQLQKLDLRLTCINEPAISELVCVPALTALEPIVLTWDAFAHLPRFPHLQLLSLFLNRGSAAEQAEHNVLLVSALSACPALTDLALRDGDCSESFGSQLMQAMPQLRSLCFHLCSLPSLVFLIHAPNLKRLSLTECSHVRPGHLFGLGSFAPQLESLSVDDCRGLQLDEAEVRLLTPPAVATLGLLLLRAFDYRPSGI